MALRTMGSQSTVREQTVSWVTTKGCTPTGILALACFTALVATSLCTVNTLKEFTSMPTPREPLLPPFKHLTRAARSWLTSCASLSHMPKEQRLALLLAENQWKNSLVTWVLPRAARDALPHFVQTWFRCCSLCYAIYLCVGALWCYYIYHCFGDLLFKPGQVRALRNTLEQLKVSVLAVPLYSLLPAVTEWFAEQGLTRAYPRVDNVGLPLYLAHFCLYMACVEFAVYWMHRGLHEVKWAYKWLHHIHHKYNKEHTLSPFAGLAFHPLDGILQAVPYTWTLFFCPMHFLTHEMLLFATVVWTTNIHDNIHGKGWPIMGAKYHTIHHTDYKSNYGHYFVFMDHLFGTLLTPEEEAKRKTN